MSNQTPRDKVIDFAKKMAEHIDKCEQKEKEAEELISYAKSKLMKMEPFFAMLLFKMPTFPNYSVETAATDGTVLMYNPHFIVDTMLRKDLVFLLLHEIEHVFFKHTIRGPVKATDANKLFSVQHEIAQKGEKNIFIDDQVKRVRHTLMEWNHATDYVINHHTKENIKVPISEQMEKNMLLDKKYADWTSEKVYDDIKTEYDPDKEQSGEGTGSMDLGIGGVLPQGLGQLDDKEIRQLEKEFEQDVQSAAHVARRAGKLPKGTQHIIDSMYTTTTPWQDVFRTIFTSIQKQDYTFQYPNKRYTQHMMDYGVIMPSLWGEEYVNCGFIMDTSGSVGEDEKAILASELKHILEDYNIKLYVLYCDTKAYINDVQIFTPDDIKNNKLTLNTKGGGGTAMRPAFDYFRDNQDDENFQIVICMTDMYLSDWGNLGSKPPFSVYWAALPGYDKKIKPDFGTVIEIVLDKGN